MQELLGALYLVFAAFLMIRLITIFKKKRVNTEFVINVSVLMYYAIPGIRHCIFGFEGNYASSYGWFVEPTFYGFFLIILFYFTFTLLFHAKMREDNSYILKINRANDTTRFIVIGVLFFSMACFALYCNLFGGIKVLLSSIHSIRDGIVLSNNASYEFLNKLYNVVLYAPVLLFAYWNKKKSYRVLIIISLISAFLIQLSKGGRGAMLQFFMVFIIARINIEKDNKVLIKKLLQLMVLGVIFIVLYRPLIFAAGMIREHGVKYAFDLYLTQITREGRYSAASPFAMLRSLLNAFDHYFVSVETAIKMVGNGGHRHNYFGEFWIMLCSPIPSLLLGVNKGQSLTVFNSAYIAGEVGVAQIPPGIVASAYYSGGVIWVIFYAVLAGYVGRKIEAFYKRIKENVIFAHEYYAAILFVYMSFCISGDFSNDFRQQLTSLFLFVIIRISMVKVRKRYEKDCTSFKNRENLWRCGKKIREGVECT